MELSPSPTTSSDTWLARAFLRARTLQLFLAFEEAHAVGNPRRRGLVLQVVAEPLQDAPLVIDLVRLAPQAGDTVWRVRTVLPKLGWIVFWLRSPLVHQLTLFLAPLLLAVLAVLQIWRRPADYVPEGHDAARTSGV